MKRNKSYKQDAERMQETPRFEAFMQRRSQGQAVEQEGTPRFDAFMQRQQQPDIPVLQEQAQETPDRYNFLDTVSRARVAGLDTPQEKEAAVRQMYGPNARYIENYISEDPNLNRRAVWSPNGVDYYPVEPVSGEAFTNLWRGEARDLPRNYINALAEPFRDTAEFLSGDSNSMAIEAGLTVAAATPPGRAVQGAGVLARGANALRRSYAARPVLTATGISGASGLAGEASDQILQSLLGTQYQSVREQLGQIVVSGGGEATGAAIGELSSRGIGRIIQGGILRSKPEAVEAQQTIDRMAQSRVQRREQEAQQAVADGKTPPRPLTANERNPRLLPAQMTDSQIAARLSAQTAALDDTLNQVVDAQRSLLVNELQDAASRGNINQARDTLVRTYEELQAQASRDLGALRAAGEDVDFAAAGLALKEGRQAYEVHSGQLVDGLYQTARALDPDNRVRFNASGIREELDAVLSELQRGVPQEPRIGVSESGELPTETLTPDWRPNYAGLSPTEEAALNKVVQGVSNIDWSRASMDDLRTIMQSLGNMSATNRDGVKLPQALATRLREAIRRASQNPINAPEGYTEAWRAATNAAAERFVMLEKQALASLTLSDRPFADAQRFLNPSNVDDLRNLREAFFSQGEPGAEAWTRFTDGFKTDLMNRVGELPQILEQYGGRNQNAALDLLLTPSERQAVEELSLRMSRLQQTRIDDLARIQEYNNAFVEDLFRNNIPTAQVQSYREFLERAGGANWQTSAPGQAFRGAIMQRVVSNVVEPVAGRPGRFRINQNRLRREMEQIERGQLQQFLTEGDKTLLSDIQRVVPFIESAATDVGAGIVAGGSVAKVFEGPIDAFLQLAPYRGAAFLLTNKQFQEFLAGAGRPARNLEYTAAVVGRLLDDFLSEESEAGIAEGLFLAQQDEALNQGQFSNYGNMGPM